MEILTFVKRVPSTTANVEIKDQQLDTSNCEFEINPYDLFAVEEGLRQKEAAGDGNVTAISLGGDAAQKELRTTLAMGADAALLLKSEGAGNADTSTTAKAITNAIADRPYDLLVFGKQSVDRDQHGVGPAVATRLDIPCITEVTSLSIEGGQVTARRDVEGATETITASLPCAITCQKGLNEPRLASLKGIMAAKKKPLEVIDTELPAAALTVDSTQPPAARAAGRMVADSAELVEALRNEAKIL
ncbi:MAG: electron transfer flavoprotein subunit beta/FixA family protein [Planctomycetota bacterium]|jgi:electron transfer flavoprotein beta subunit|nr:electron transfer flavoprotein subunit beta/FixA family protein [Planctomycetota bacterium]